MPAVKQSNGARSGSWLLFSFSDGAQFQVRLEEQTGPLTPILRSPVVIGCERREQRVRDVPWCTFRHIADRACGVSA